MASHHHCGGATNHATPYGGPTNHATPCSGTPATCCCCHSPCTPYHHHHSPPPQPLQQPDPLLQALASQLLQRHHKPPHHTHKPQSQSHHPTLSSLIHRIETLETSLHYLYLSSRPPPPLFLKHSAARTIQTHFRAFLVRRSRTLRNLKHLASIKSTFNNLKSSVSQQPHYFDSYSLSRKSMDLLLELDSIQDGDPLIRDGKRLISRELVRFLEIVDGVSAKRKQISTKFNKNLRFGGNCCEKSWGLSGFRGRKLGGDKMELGGELRGRVEEIPRFSRVLENDEEDVELEGFHHVSDEDEDSEENPRIDVLPQFENVVLVKRNNGVQVQPKLRKRVSFVENGNVVSMVCENTNEANVDESGSSDDHVEVGGISRVSEVDDNDDNDDDDNGDDENEEDIGERNTRRGEKVEGECEIVGHYHRGQNGNVSFSAPLPVKMESRADLIKK